MKTTHDAMPEPIASLKPTPAGDNCATCVRWLRVKTWPTGKCGKRGWRTDENDWCSVFAPKGKAQ